MADALCGPSNAVQNFQKHASVDRTLQQDRISSQQSSSQGFRSHNPNERVLDPEFNAFESGFPGPLLADGPNPAAFLPPGPQPHSRPYPENSGWTTDFQKLQISRPSQPGPQHQFGAGASINQATSTGWKDEFISEPQQATTQGMLGHGSSMGGRGFAGPNQFMATNNVSPFTRAHEAQPEEVFDESAFEAAFAEARAEVELQEVNQQPPEETSQTPAAEELVKIGSDNIPAQLDGINESDALAQTAGELLDRVGHNQSQKFKESNFLALMRQLRDREIIVEGDEFRQAAQPLHPGGPLYPEQSRLLSKLDTESAGKDTSSSLYNANDLHNPDSGGYESQFGHDRNIDFDILHKRHEEFGANSLFNEREPRQTVLVGHRMWHPPGCLFRHDFDHQGIS